MSSKDLDEGPERIEAVVLSRVLDLHPSRVTMAELLRDLTVGTANPDDERDDIEAAVESLTQVSLLHPVGDDRFVTPTRAAVHLGELFEIS